MALDTTPLLGRKDRHVSRTFVRMDAHTSRTRVNFYLEEALRLVSLPGEDEGRVYHFRRISLLALPADAPRTVWIERLQHAVLAQAREAVHGASAQSHHASAVFFHHEQEAFELILRSAFAPASKPAWFWQPAVGLSPDVPRADRVAILLEHLREQRTPREAAAILLAAIDGASPNTLLSALPTFAARDWLRSLEATGTAPLDVRPIEVSEGKLLLLQSAVDDFGPHDDRTLWLATQIAITMSPSSQSLATAVKRAHATLQRLASQHLKSGDSFAKPATQPVSPHVLRFDDDGAITVPHTSPGSTAPEAARGISAPISTESPAPNRHKSAELRGDRTSAAGLYFLLNALHHLNILAAFERCPVLADKGLAAHLLRKLAMDAGGSPDDIIFSVVASELHAHPSFQLSPSDLDTLRSTPQAFPKGYALSPSSPLSADRFLRLWALAVRRWCSRAGGISAREIIVRPGRVWLTRSDLDVTLSLSDADIRIRRLGLDIDPGWVSWLGPYGLVVRFHYRGRGMEDEPC